MAGAAGTATFLGVHCDTKSNCNNVLKCIIALDAAWMADGGAEATALGLTSFVIATFSKLYNRLHFTASTAVMQYLYHMSHVCKSTRSDRWTRHWATDLTRRLNSVDRGRYPNSTALARQEGMTCYYCQRNLPLPLAEKIRKWAGKRKREDGSDRDALPASKKAKLDDSTVDEPLPPAPLPAPQVDAFIALLRREYGEEAVRDGGGKLFCKWVRDCGDCVERGWDLTADLLMSAAFRTAYRKDAQNVTLFIAKYVRMNETIAAAFPVFKRLKGTEKMLV
jgi:hypothetical protein